MFLLGPPIHRRVDQWLHILLIDGFGLGLSRSTVCGPIFSWLKPFGLGSCILYETTLDCFALALVCTLTKDELETPWGIGRPALSDPGPRDCAHRIDMKKISDTHKEGRNWILTRTLHCNPTGTPTL